MPLKRFNPVTPGSRNLTTVDRSSLHDGDPMKSLTKGFSRSGGRNNLGRVTSRFRGGGHKRCYRFVDFKRRNFGVEGVVERIEYDPNRSAFLSLVRYSDGDFSYLLAPQKMVPGDRVIAGDTVDVKPGNATYLSSLPVGTIVHNLELKPGKGAQLVRAAGTFAQIVGRDRGYVIVRLRSGEQRMILGRCMASVGAVSNPDHMNVLLGKAGRARWLGRRPHNRGVSMNPIDHPHGGGAGRTSGGRNSVTPWGKSTKGGRAKSRKTSSKFIVRSRHAKKG